MTDRPPHQHDLQAGGTGATLAQAAGHYDERPVAPSLQLHFNCVWHNRFSASDPASILVMPDGHIDLMWLDGRFVVAGPDSTPQVSMLVPGTTVVGFRFRPGAAASWLGVPAVDLRNRRVSLEDIRGRAARRMAEQAADAASLAHALQDALAALAPQPSPRLAEMTAAYRLVASGAPPGRPLMPWLTAELGMTERTLRRRCEEAFGYGPKTLDRILRFQRFLALLRQRPPGDVAGLAVEAGYADQPHVTRESNRLASATPGALWKLLGGQRPGGS